MLIFKMVISSSVNHRANDANANALFTGETQTIQ